METANAETQCSHKIVLSNLLPEEKVSYSLVLIKGYIKIGNINNSCFNSDSNVVNLSNVVNNQLVEWPVVENKFKCLADLCVGENNIVLKYCKTSYKLKLNYSPRNTKFFVTPVYIVCKDHNGHFQAPPNSDSSVETACRKIGIGARLIQCLTAEKLHESGFGRRTFQLERDLYYTNSECVQFQSSLSVTEARSMVQEELWTYFGREIMSSSIGAGNRKFLAFLSCTEWDGKSRVVRAHAALGGGGLALFGTACLHTWPSDVKHVIACFLDSTPVDTRYLMDDSCYRGTYGACFSTTLGSACHELGHTFDLGHPRQGIMGRGFDNVHLVFTPLVTGTATAVTPLKTNAQSCTVTLVHNLNVQCAIGSPLQRRSPMPVRHAERAASAGLESGDDDLTSWAPGCAAILTYHRWFNTEIGSSIIKSDLHFDRSRLVVTGRAGLRVVEVRGAGGVVLGSWQFASPKLRSQFVVPAQTFSSALLLLAQDSNGNMIKVNV